MMMTYKAILRGDRLVWIEAPPATAVVDDGVPVHVTFLHEALSENEEALAERQESLRALLEELVALNPFADIDDPVAWQREIRRDRALAWDE
ncbi:MAG: hypothetical protein KA170_11005 [Candidatus Promineofilum sp.]|nr:hypothetical protein [Promineifilum sp.]